MSAKLKLAGVMAVGVIAGALGTIQFQAIARSDGLFAVPAEEVRQLATVFGIIKENYVEPINEKKLFSDAITGMVGGLDPHSQYFDKKTLREFMEGTSGRFVGVGIEIGMEDGLVKVATPIEGSPAFVAGIKSGDLITRIDETPVKGLTMDQAVKRMRGEPNTKVVLTIFRKTENRTFPVTITRAEIQVQSVRGKMIEPGFAWLRISQFQDRTVNDFARKLEEFYAADPNLKGIVLDLRNDPGGKLEGAIAVSAAFLPSSTVVVSTKGQVASARATYKAQPFDYLRGNEADPLRRLPEAVKNVPMVVLVNDGSASASEIVAGALQDHKRAVVMGSQTFGKGSVQSVICLEGRYPLEKCPGAGMKLTTQRYYTPNGRSIQAEGIVPDVWLDETAEGNILAGLRQREVDLEKHLTGADEKARDAARDKAREDARKKIEEQVAKGGPAPRAPEFGSAEDFQLQQALNRLKGKTVQVSKTLTERKPTDTSKN
jgi:carboxyl-terminal processing protease